MIRINKGIEPTEWTAQKTTPGFTGYEPNSALRDALLIEQGYICAYCMRRIPTKDVNTDATSKIEHIKSRQDRPDLQFVFSNMAICCPGNLNDEPHCDKLKKGNSVSFDLYNDALQQSIRYSTKDGHIESTNVQWDAEINDLLNLNHLLLKQNRKATLLGIIEAITAKGWSISSLRTKLNKWNAADSQGKLKPFCGIVIWYLQKKLNQR